MNNFIKWKKYNKYIIKYGGDPKCSVVPIPNIYNDFNGSARQVIYDLYEYTFYTIKKIANGGCVSINDCDNCNIFIKNIIKHIRQNKNDNAIVNNLWLFIPKKILNPSYDEKQKNIISIFDKENVKLHHPIFEFLQNPQSGKLGKIKVFDNDNDYQNFFDELSGKILSILKKVSNRHKKDNIEKFIINHNINTSRNSGSNLKFETAFATLKSIMDKIIDIDMNELNYNYILENNISVTDNDTKEYTNKISIKSLVHNIMTIKEYNALQRLSNFMKEIKLYIPPPKENKYEDLTKELYMKAIIYKILKTQNKEIYNKTQNKEAYINSLYTNINNYYNYVDALEKNLRKLYELIYNLYDDLYEQYAEFNNSIEEFIQESTFLKYYINAKLSTFKIEIAFRQTRNILQKYMNDVNGTINGCNGECDKNKIKYI